MKTVIKVLLIFSLSSFYIFSQPHWQFQNSGTNNYLRDLQFISENTGWVVGHGGTILKTTNGGDVWIQQNSNTSTDLICVFFLNDQVGWVGGYNGIILMTTNGGDNWELNQLGFGSENVFELYFTDVQTGIVLIGNTVPYYYSYILKTTNGGSTWNLEDEFYGEAYLDLFGLGSNDWVVGTGVSAYSLDSGNNWNFVYPNTDQWLYDVYFYNNTTGWAVGGNDASEIILKSENGGASWQILRESFQYKRLHGVHFVNPNVGWTVGQNGIILRTTNGGLSWFSNNSPTINFLREVQFVNDSTGWAIGENGTIIKTEDGGVPVELVSFSARVRDGVVKLQWATASELNNMGFDIERKNCSHQNNFTNWEKIDFISGFGSTTEPKTYSITDVAVTSGTFSYRLKQIDYDGTFTYSPEIDVEVDLTPSEFLLFQNYPNPFNPSTQIQYSLPVNSYISIEVYSLLGDLVATLVQGNQLAGNHFVDFNADNLPSSPYIYMMKTNSQSYTKKMLLLK